MKNTPQSSAEWYGLGCTSYHRGHPGCSFHLFFELNLTKNGDKINTYSRHTYAQIYSVYLHPENSDLRRARPEDRNVKKADQDMPYEEFYLLNSSKGDAVIEGSFEDYHNSVPCSMSMSSTLGHRTEYCQEHGAAHGY